MNEFLESSIRPGDSRAELLQETALIIWDEAPMANKAVFACVDSTLRTVMDSDEPFGGKVIVLLGDFRQTCPVVRRGRKADVLDASIRTSPLWSLFRIWHLTIPVRNAYDGPFQQFVDDIGNGLTPSVSLSTFQTVSTSSQLIDFVFPIDVLRSPSLCRSRSILAPTNQQIDDYNSAVLRRVEGIQRTYLAADSIKEIENVDLPCPRSLLDYVSKQTPPGLPSYHLTVKVGAIYRLLRNLSLSRGMVKNTRVIVTQLGQRLLTVRKMTSYHSNDVDEGDDVLLPRISFSTILPSTNHTFLRKQFPIAPAYATTFNSCQGLTLDCIGLDLSRPVFTHGQLYTAFSRVRQ